MSSNRRDFLKKTFTILGASAVVPNLVMADGGESDIPTFKIPYKNTYVKNTFVTENNFRIAKPNIVPTPSLEKAKEVLPQPFWEGHDGEIEMYWKAWEIALTNIRHPTEKSGFISSYIDTAYNGHIFMWDSAFIMMFTKYGTNLFPFQNTLDNFYAKQHPDGFICREIMGDAGEDCFQRYDPVSTGPNLLPWSEMEYFKLYGDKERLNKVFPVLCAYNRWFKLNRTWRDGSYWSSGWGTGMDNMPRVQPEYNMIYSHGHMVWLDTCLQQLMTAKILLEMGLYLERWQEIEDFEDEVHTLSKVIKDQLWDPSKNFLFDQYKDGSHCTTMGIGAYWALYTDVLNEEEREKFIAHLTDEELFNRPNPFPSIPANHPKYRPNGRYWQGGVWAPTNYMVLKGLQRHTEREFYYPLARKHYDQIYKVYQDTGTFWEYYSPEKIEPGFMARPNFVGWTGLPPIAVLIEMVFGIKIDGAEMTINWDINLTEKFGIKQLPLGTKGMISLEAAARTSEDKKPKITVETDTPCTINIRWAGGTETYAIEKGKVTL